MTQVADDPEHDGERDRADQRRSGQHLALGRLEAVQRVPDQMADAAEHMMHQRPGEAEQDQPADQAAHEAFEVGIGVGAGGGGDQPPGKQQHAEIRAAPVTRCAIDIIIVSIGL